MAKLNLKIWGVRGGDPSWNENKGACSMHIDNDGIISADAFKGAGETYQRRAYAYINIESEGAVHFEGTFDRLRATLNSAKTLKEQNEKMVAAISNFLEFRKGNHPETCQHVFYDQLEESIKSDQ